MASRTRWQAKARSSRSLRAAKRTSQAAAERLRTETGGDVLPIQADCRRAEDCVRVAETARRELGGIDILVNNDGAPPLGPLLSFDDTAWAKAIEQNLMYVVRMVRDVVPSMKERGGGSILNITAISAIQPIPGFSLSVATWSGVIGYAKTLSLEVAPLRINVNTICPGYIDTTRLQKVFAAGSEPAEVVQSAIDRGDSDEAHRDDRRHRESGRSAGFAEGPLHHRDGDPGGRRIAARSSVSGRRPTEGEIMIEVPRPPTRQDIETYRSKGWWKDQTFAEILERRARETPHREAIVDARRRITYGQLWAEVKRFAEFLRRQGVQRGDVVTLQLPNRIEFPVVFYSLELIGAVANKISADFRAVEVEYILEVLEIEGVRLRQHVQGLRLPGNDRRAASAAARPVARDLRRRRRHPGRHELRRSRARHTRNRGRGSGADVAAGGHADVLHVRHDRQSQGRSALLQHHALHLRDLQHRARRHGPGSDARLSARRAQLGVHDARAGGDGRRQGGLDGALFRGRRAGARSRRSG